MATISESERMFAGTRVEELPSGFVVATAVLTGVWMIGKGHSDRLFVTPPNRPKRLRDAWTVFSPGRLCLEFDDVRPVMPIHKIEPSDIVWRHGKYQEVPSFGGSSYPLKIESRSCVKNAERHN